MKKNSIDENTRIIRQIVTVLLAVLMVISGSVPAYASELELNGIDRSQSCSITMTVNVDEWYVDGSTFRLYKVADLADDLTFSYVDEFEDCGVSLKPNSAASYKASDLMGAASSLIQYVRDNGIQEEEAVQIHNRTMTFSGLSLGLYLVQGDTAKEGNRTVTYQPVVICIPQRNSSTEAWRYNITSQVKSADPQYVNTETPATETPAKPTTPSNKNTTTTTKTSAASKKKVKTGDTSRTRFYLMVLLIDVAAIAGILVIRNRRKKKG